MLPLHAPVDPFPIDVIPVDVVPSAMQSLLLPLCEGIVVGLLLGSVLMFVLTTVERLLAPSPDNQPTDAPSTDAPSTENRRTLILPRHAPRPVARPAAGARQLPTRPHRPAPGRPTLLAKLA